MAYDSRTTKVPKGDTLDKDVCLDESSDECVRKDVTVKVTSDVDDTCFGPTAEGNFLPHTLKVFKLLYTNKHIIYNICICSRNSELSPFCFLSNREHLLRGFATSTYMEEDT